MVESSQLVQYIYIYNIIYICIGWEKFPSTAILGHFLELVGGFNDVFIMCHPHWDDNPIGVPCDTALECISDDIPFTIRKT